MSQHGPPPGPPIPGAAPGDRNFPGHLNHQVPPDVSSDVPNAETAPRSGRVADEAFVRALYAEHGGALLRYALHLTGGDRQRAEDLVQETIVRAWRHPEALADRPARPWLFAVARNLAVDSYRARQARPPETGQAALELLPSDDDADRTLESWAVGDALAGLAGLPALLARVNPDEISRICADDTVGTVTDERPPGELIGTVLDLAQARRRRNRWRFLAAAAAVVAIAGGLFGGLSSMGTTQTVGQFSAGSGPWDTVKPT